jgi:hypothetical protein
LIEFFGENILKGTEYSAAVFFGPVLYLFGGCELLTICNNNLIALKIDENCPNDCSG